MFRLTFRYNEADDDSAHWNARVRNAVPEPLFVAAYLDDTTLEIFVNDAGEEAIRAIVGAIGLGECRICVVVPLDGDVVDPPTTVPTVRVAKPHAGRIVAVEPSADGRKLCVKVRHAQYECVDRVERVETNATVQLAAWVGSVEDDPRAEFATLSQAFSDVTLELDRPLAGRGIVYDRG